MDRAFELGRPEGEEFRQHRIFRGDVVILPDIGLEEPRMVGKMVKDLCCGEAIAFELPLEGMIGPHNCSPI